MRVIYFGSTEFSLAGLEALRAQHEIVAVVTRPDRPAGRGRSLLPTPVKERSVQLGIHVLQPENLSEKEFLDAVRGLAPDLGVTAAYGSILPLALLNIPRLGCLNLHASLLPRWRGAAPIQRAIMAGDEITGVSLMVMEPGLDTGPVVDAVEVPIMEDDTGTSLERKTATAGAELLARTLPAWEKGDIAPVPQDDSRATYAPPLRREERRVDWREGDRRIHNLVRALAESPGAYTTFRGKRLIILRTSITGIASPGQPGELHLTDGELRICSGDRLLTLERVKPEGKRPMSGAEFVRGYRIERERMGE